MNLMERENVMKNLEALMSALDEWLLAEHRGQHTINDLTMFNRARQTVFKRLKSRR